MKRFVLLSVFLTAMVLLASCTRDDFGGYTYADFDRIDEWETLSEVGQDEYELIYVYDRDFLGCESEGTFLINEELFVFAMEGDHDLTMRLINFREVSGERPPNIARRGPKLLVMKEGEVQDKFYGAGPIYRFIEAFEDGQYWMPDSLGTLPGYEETYGEYTYDDFEHIRNWYAIRDMAWEGPEVIYVYGRDQEGTTEASAQVNEAAFMFAADNAQGIPVSLVNLHDVIGIGVDDLRFEEPALLILGNEQIQEAIYGVDAILAFLETADTHDFEQYME